jgi:transcription elongation factor GreA
MEALDLREKIAEAASAPLDGDSPEAFQALDGLLAAVEETRQIQGLAEIAGEALSRQPLDPVRFYLHAFALIRLGRPEDAVKPLIALAGKLEQEKAWGLLGALLPKVIDTAPSVEAARSIAKLAETIGVTKVDAAALEQAYDLYPNEERLAYQMGELAAARGRLEEAQGYWAESLDGFVTLKRYERLEESMLKVAESDTVEHQRHVLNVLYRLADQHQWGRFGTLADLALPGLRKANLVQDLWRHVLHYFPKAAGEVDLRKWILSLAPEAFPSAEGILDLLGRSGVLDPQIKPEVSVRQLETLLEFAPGFHVLHASWGIGRVRLNDGDTLVLDFHETKNHRMKLTLARKALTVLPADDLRVLQSESPEELKRLVKTEPAEVIVRALRMTRGEATTQDLRRTITGHKIVSTGSWTTFWKEARTAIESDDRMDLSQSFRQVYRLKTDASEDEDLMSLPIIEPRRGIRPNLNLIRRFLEQHPDETARASRIYTPMLERWARDERTSAEDRVATHLQLYRWRREVRPDFVETVMQCVMSSSELTGFSDLEDQRLLAKIAVDSEDHWKDGCLFVLSSRSVEVRAIACERMRRTAGPGRSALIELLTDPSSRPQSALTVIDLALETPPEPFVPDPWRAALAVVLLIDQSTKEPVRKQALALLSEHGPLAESLRETPFDPGDKERWSAVLRRWRSSERFLEPVLRFLKAVGHTELVDQVKSAHAERTDRILGAMGTTATVDYSGHLMTRATYQKTLHERNWLVWELKTTVAQTIRKARELGDLKENAEYHAAKQKQADYAHQATEMTERLSKAKIIEELRLPPDEVAPGTEIVVADANSGEERRFWLLGEGDGWLGDGVLSSAAPLGRALLHKKAGERVTIAGADRVHDYVVRSIAKKLPRAEEKVEELTVTDDDLREVVSEIESESDGA